MNRRILTTLVILLGSGCYREAEDNAEVCVLPQGAGMTMPAPTGPLDYLEDEQVVVLAGIYSSGDPVKDALCEVTVSDSDISIHISYKYKRQGFGAAEDAHFTSVSCPIPPLDAGTYTIHFDDRERELTIPSHATAPCFFPGEP